MSDRPQLGQMRNLVIRSFASEAEQKIMATRRDQSWGHIRPHSVLVVAMGSHWLPGCWQKVADMVAFTNKAGVYCGLSELQDRCLTPYDALGTMRNEGLLMGQSEGFDWLCYVDNDIWPNPDALLRLINRDMSVIAPFVIEAGTGRKLHGPFRDPDTGLQPVKWTVLSMLLFKTSVFNCTGPNFWRDAIGADEGYHFQLLWHYGHRPWLDTDTAVQDLSRPLYPLASKMLPRAEQEALWDKKNAQMLQAPDRRPIDPNDPSMQEGVYWPFTNLKAKPAEDTGTSGVGTTDTEVSEGGIKVQRIAPAQAGAQPDGGGDDPPVADGGGNVTG